MKLSDYLYEKGLETDKQELTKLASECEYTEDDIDIDIEKMAGIWDELLPKALTLGKNLLKTPAIRNAAIGAGTGALTSAATSDHPISSAFKGAVLGGAVGGLGTIGKDFYKSKIAQRAAAKTTEAAAAVAPKTATSAAAPAIERVKPVNVDMNQKIPATQFKGNPTALDVPSAVRNDATYASAEKAGVDVFSQGQDMNQARNLANASNPVKPNSFHTQLTQPNQPLWQKIKNFSGFGGSKQLLKPNATNIPNTTRFSL